MCDLISKQLLGISIAATLIFTTTGCGSSSTTTKTSRQALPESIQNLSFDKHLNISVGYWNIEEMEKAAEPDAMTQYIEDLFNITLEPMAVTWSNYKERYQILSATGSLPDVFATLTLSSNDNNDSATFSDFINTGVIRALPEDLTDYPRLNEVLNSGRTEMEIKVIKKILYSPRIKQKELAEDVGASVSTVQRIIKKLVKEEKIVRMNGKRNGYWKVL